MYKYKPLIPRSILDEYFNPLVFWYQWNYLRSPAKNLPFVLQGIWLIGHISN